MPLITKLVRYTETFFNAGEAKFVSGEHYPLTEETERHVAAGIAVVVEVDLDADKAQRLADKALTAATRATAAAEEAQRLADAAAEAQRHADAAAAALTEGQKAAENTPVAAPAEVDSAAVAAAAKAETNARADLASSATLPEVIDLPNGNKVPLGTIVTEAFEASGLTAVAWNDLAAVDRDALLSQIVAHYVAANPVDSGE